MIAQNLFTGYAAVGGDPDQGILIQTDDAGVNEELHCVLNRFNGYGSPIVLVNPQHMLVADNHSIGAVATVTVVGAPGANVVQRDNVP